MSNKCKKNIVNPILKHDCLECTYSDNCALKKWNERQTEIIFQ